MGDASRLRLLLLTDKFACAYFCACLFSRADLHLATLLPVLCSVNGIPVLTQLWNEGWGGSSRCCGKSHVRYGESAKCRVEEGAEAAQRKRMQQRMQCGKRQCAPHTLLSVAPLSLLTGERGNTLSHSTVTASQLLTHEAISQEKFGYIHKVS
jgi:hypothetical protein